MHAHRSRVATAALLLILAAAAVAGCGDDNDGPTGPGGNPTNTGFTGLFAGSGAAGKLTVNISGSNLAGALRAGRVSRAGAHETYANAVLAPSGGSNVSLFGIYSDEKDSLYVAGGGYILIGHYDDSVVPPSITGSFTSTGGDGIFGCFLGGSPAIKVYCGSFESTLLTTTGSWTFATYDTALAGVAFPAGGSAITFTGTVERTGATRAIAFAGGDPGTLDLTGTGALDTATNIVSGDWVLDDVNDIEDDAGTWDGVLCP